MEKQEHVYDTIIEMAKNECYNLFKQLTFIILIAGFVLGICLGVSAPKTSGLTAQQFEAILGRAYSDDDEQMDNDKAGVKFSVSALLVTWTITGVLGASMYAMYLHLANQNAILNLMLIEHENNDVKKYGCIVRPRS